MDIDARLSSLGERHRTLDSQIEEEMRRPMQDDILLHDLKRQKLAIKDEIFTLEAKRRPN